jgi:hypothetical protein
MPTAARLCHCFQSPPCRLNSRSDEGLTTVSGRAQAWIWRRSRRRERASKVRTRGWPTAASPTLSEPRPWEGTFGVSGRVGKLCRKFFGRLAGVAALGVARAARAPLPRTMRGQSLACSCGSLHKKRQCCPGTILVKTISNASSLQKLSEEIRNTTIRRPWALRRPASLQLVEHAQCSGGTHPAR